MIEVPNKLWVKMLADTHGDCRNYRPDGYVEVLRADTAIPKAEADAMVAAAFMEVIQALDSVERKVSDGVAWCDWNKACHYVEVITPADARVAFEQAVREAVDAALEDAARWCEHERQVCNEQKDSAGAVAYRRLCEALRKRASAVKEKNNA